MSDQETTPELLSLRKASLYIGAGTSTIEKWIDKGYLTAYTLPDGSQRRLKKSEIDQMIGGLDVHRGKATR